MSQLHEQGYEEARLVSNYFSDRDIMLGTMPIEVKAARARNHKAGGVWRKRWQFDAIRGPKHTDYVLILVAVDHNDQPFPFVIPSWLVSCQNNIHITSYPTAYRGRFAPYLGQWWQVEATKSLHDYYNGQAFLFMGNGDSARNTAEWGQKSGSACSFPELSPSPLGIGA